MTRKNRKSPEVTFFDTADGSQTLYTPAFDEHYHNSQGAVSESRHVFFEQPGLISALENRKSLSIFETGLGTGLNLALLHHFANQKSFAVQISYFGVEAYPIGPETIANIHFGDELATPTWLVSIFENLEPGHNFFQIDGPFRLEVSIYVGFFEHLEYSHHNPLADFIWHDAFAPYANPELWQAPPFKKLYRWSSPNAIISTYAAASAARAGMAAAGWFPFRAPGALGKREMTLAAKNPSILAEFKPVKKDRLAGRYHNRDFHPISGNG